MNLKKQFCLSGSNWNAIVLWAVHSNNLKARTFALPELSLGEPQRESPRHSAYPEKRLLQNRHSPKRLQKSPSAVSLPPVCWFTSGRLIWMWLWFSYSLSPEVADFRVLPLAAPRRAARPCRCQPQQVGWRGGVLRAPLKPSVIRALGWLGTSDISIQLCPRPFMSFEKALYFLCGWE